MRGFLALVLLTVMAAVAATARAEPRVTTFALENGMQAVVIEDHRAPVVTHMVWYRVGAADEPWGKSGIAHFFEHLMFKGTKTIPEGAFSKIVAENGGQDNAFTSWDYTAYFQRIAADRLDLVMKMEADRMRNLVLNDEVLRTERSVILEERGQRIDNSPQSLFSEQMRAALYLNHPYGVPVIGWRHEIESLGLEDAVAFYRRFYAPDNAVLVVAGDVTPDEVRRLAEKHYGPIAPSLNPPGPRPTEPPQLAARHLSMHDELVRQPSLTRHYLVPPYRPDHPEEAAALDALSEILGGGITSRLSRRLVVEERTALQVGAYYSPTARDDTSFTVYGVPAPGTDLAALEAGIDAIIARLAEEGPTDEELARVKRDRRASLIYAQDSQATQARLYGAALAIGLGVEDVQSWLARIEAVSAEQVRDAARTWLVPERSVTGWLTRNGEGG